MYMRKYLRLVHVWVITCGLAGVIAFTGEKTRADKFYTIALKNPGELKDFFKYTKERIPFASAHRGGARKGFPENCIATFENTLRHTWAILEIDPHYTKDSAIVLMHDPTLNRTSNGSGKVSDYTLEQLQQFRLKDPEGNVTEYSIPTLDAALQWAKGKTVLVLDQKDVPLEARVKKIQEHNAQANAIVIVYSLDDAKKCYEMDKNIMMEVMMPHKEAMSKFEATGIPWSNIVAFVTHTQPADVTIYQQLHDKGVMCIIGSSRTIDRQYLRSEQKDKQLLTEKYQSLIHSGADIIEADLGIEAGRALMHLANGKSSKKKYFRVATLSK